MNIHQLTPEDHLMLDAVKRHTAAGRYLLRLYLIALLNGDVIAEGYLVTALKNMGFTDDIADRRERASELMRTAA